MWRLVSYNRFFNYLCFNLSQHIEKLDILSICKDDIEEMSSSKFCGGVWLDVGGVVCCVTHDLIIVFKPQADQFEVIYILYIKHMLACLLLNTRKDAH